MVQRLWQRHSLSIVASAILLLWLGLYLISDPHTHLGSFFGNAIADWMGVVMTVLATKWFFEKGSKESRQPRRTYRNRFHELLHEHSLTIFLLATGAAWCVVFVKMDPESTWGTVVSNIVSEWLQQIGLVLLTKKLYERGSKDSEGSEEKAR